MFFFNINHCLAQAAHTIFNVAVKEENNTSWVTLHYTYIESSIYNLFYARIILHWISCVLKQVKSVSCRSLVVVLPFTTFLCILHWVIATINAGFRSECQIVSAKFALKYWWEGRIQGTNFLNVATSMVVSVLAKYRKYCSGLYRKRTTKNLLEHIVNPRNISYLI